MAYVVGAQDELTRRTILSVRHDFLCGRLPALAHHLRPSRASSAWSSTETVSTIAQSTLASYIAVSNPPLNLL